MDLIENIKESLTSIPVNDNNFVYLMTIEHQIEHQEDIKSNWRALKNGLNSIAGTSNRKFMERYVKSGFWLNFKNRKNNIMLVLFTSLKPDINGFFKHFQIRYHALTRNRPIIQIARIKLSDGKTIYTEINEIVNKEIYSDGIPLDIKLSCFGALWAKNKKLEKEFPN